MNFEVQFLLCMLSMIERAMNLGKDLLRSDTPEEIELVLMAQKLQPYDAVILKQSVESYASVL